MPDREEAATAGHATAGGEPRFVGRDGELGAALAAAGGRPGMLVVVGAPWIGTTRLATEVAARLERDGAARVRPRGEGGIDERLAAGLVAEDLRADPVSSSQLRPFVAVVGDLGADAGEALAIGAALSGTPGLLIACVGEIPVGPSFVELEPLDEEASTAIVEEVAPGLAAITLARILRIGAGRPGVLVPLARTNRRLTGDGAALRMPSSLTRPFDELLGRLDPPSLDVARWAAVVGSAFQPADLVRLTGRSEEGLAAVLDGLVAAELVEEVGGPGPLRLHCADPLGAEAVRQLIPPSELRRRNRAVLRARRERGEEPAELVENAVGTGDPDDIVAISLRAAAVARERGEAGRALAHADRALAWCDPSPIDEGRLEALTARGLALGGLGRWDEATAILDDVIRGQRRAGREAAALRAVTEWTRIRWYAGYHAEAAELIRQNVTEGGAPLAERAHLLNNAAMFAKIAGRQAEAYGWAVRAREEALACGDQLAAIQALNALGFGVVFSSASPDGLSHFREAKREARAGGYWRQAAVTLNNESCALNALGMARQAADRAQEGLDICDGHAIAEVDAPLSQNLAEALASLGRFRDSRRASVRAREAYLAMGSRAYAQYESWGAWIDFAQAGAPEALHAFRASSVDAHDGTPLEHLAPVAAMHVHVAHAAGELDEARAVAREGLARRGDTDDRLDSLGLLGAACAVLAPREARPFRTELQFAAAAGAPLAPALLAYADGWNAQSKAAASTAFREAAQRFADTGWAWWSARSLMLAGESAGRTKDAIEHLLEARRMFREMEAPAWRAQCEAGLRARGHKFVMASRHRDESVLSEREIEVLEQVALGRTNREIGERLYISEKTVGRHLERIYQRLGVGSRTAAVAAAVERGLVLEQPGQPESPSGSGAFSDVSNPETLTTR